MEKQIDTLKKKPTSTTALKKRDDHINVLNEVISELKKKKTGLFKKQKHLVWPPSTCDGPLRTKEDIISIAEMHDNDDQSQLTSDDVKGIVGRSLLLDVPGFDFVIAIPTEYMHLACLGVVKRFVTIYFMFHFFILIICPSLFLAVRPSFCLSVCMYVCKSVRPSVCPSVYFRETNLERAAF